MEFLLIFCLSWSLLFSSCNSQLQTSQSQVLLQLKKHLEYPKQLELWYDRKTEFCSLSPSANLNISCEFNSVTELKIMGDKPATQVSGFSGFPIPNKTLSETFSMDSFVTTLSRLSSLKVLSLVSLGIWGPLPDKIHRLSSLEYLDLSSNFLFGSIPPKISTLSKLQIFVLDDNVFNGTVPTWLNSLENLTFLSMNNNRLKGPFPAELFSLPNISHLSLASNSLSGSLLGNLNCGRNLGFVDISNNRIMGSLPSCLNSETSNKRVVKFSGNCLSIAGHNQHPESYCREFEVRVYKSNGGGKGKGVGVMVGLIAGISVVLVLLAIGFLVVCRIYCPRAVSEQHLLQKSVPDNSTAGFSSEILTNAS